MNWTESFEPVGFQIFVQGPHPPGNGRVEGSRFSKRKSRHGFLKKIKEPKSNGFSIGKSALVVKLKEGNKYGMEAATASRYRDGSPPKFAKGVL